MNSLSRVLSRFSWMISFLFGGFIAFLICDLVSSPYTGAGENFLMWGWIWMIVFSVVVKMIFFSETLLENISETIPNKENNLGMSYNDTKDSVGMEESEDRIDETDDVYRKAEISPQTLAATVDTPLIQEIPKEPEKLNWLVTFFSDRPLAKIGGILLFLGALFFLSLVWNTLGSVGKVIIGMLFGFSLYGIGVWMDKKGHTTESRTLLGVGIAVNTLTILSGRWIIGDESGNVFSDILTINFLILNTLFAVVTGLVYNSRTFLVFSFAFAYLIPFLVRSESESNILMILYVAVLSLGGYLLVGLYALRNEREEDMKWLFRTLMIGSLLLLFLTGFSIDTQGELIIISFTILILTGVGVYLSRKTESRDESIPAFLIGAYMILGASLFGVGDSDRGSIFIAFFSIVPLMAYTGLAMTGALISIYSWILLIPLLFGLILLGIFGAPALIFILVPIVLLYSISGVFLLGVMTGVFQLVFFIAILFFLFISSFVMDIRPVDISQTERLVMTISSLSFFILSLWSSIRYSRVNLSVTTLIATSILLVFSLIPEWSGSWIVYIVFLSLAFGYPFFIRDQIRSQFGSSIIYQVVANLFMIGELFYLGRGAWFTGNSNSLITLGSIIFVLSVASVFYSFFLLRSTGIATGELSDKNEEEKRSIITLLGIPLSLFSLAIAVTFSESPLIVSSAWILEACILAFYSSRQKNRLILSASLILLLIGILRLIPFFDTIHTGQYFALIPLTIIALALFFSAYFIPRMQDAVLEIFYDFVHIFGVSIIAYALMEIIPHTDTGWSLLGMSLFFVLSTHFYMRISSAILSYWMLSLTVMIFFIHLTRIDSLALSIGPLIVQFLALSVGTYGVWYMSRRHRLGVYALAYAFVMVLLITSIYVNKLSGSIFMVTIYLTLVSTYYLLIGINQGSPKYRTIGLYIGTVVLIKILFYDIWAGVDNLVIRVLALMISGGVMIALSQLYGRSVSRSWSDEFSLDNLTSSRAMSTATPEIPREEEVLPFSEKITSKIKDIDISNMKTLRLLDPMGKIVFETRRMGILKLAKALSLDLKKEEFAPGELRSIYNHIVPEIKSTLPKKDFDTIIDTFSRWIDTGGSIQFK